jgi:hypothetical protein
MEWAKVCAISGPAGEKELAELMEYAIKGWNIAFMDPDKEKGERICRELREKHNINIQVLNSHEYDVYKDEIHAFIYHGDWNNEEDVDIYLGFIDAKYGGAGVTIGKGGIKK